MIVLPGIIEMRKSQIYTLPNKIDVPFQSISQGMIQINFTTFAGCASFHPYTLVVSTGNFHLGFPNPGAPEFSANQLILFPSVVEEMFVLCLDNAVNLRYRSNLISKNDS